jgi:LmbE family N-acetylglucosaminyl deacetylase
MFKMKHLLVCSILCAVQFLNGQSPQAVGSADILFNLQKLGQGGSVLYIAAHPDDENTRLLTYLSKELKIRVSYMSLTRGEGGQNLVGSEQGPALGLIRTQELLAARRVDGAEQYFSRAADFGYSKTPEETFSFWNKDSVLSDVVFVIRKLRPDVIICRFPTNGDGGHGHHTASAILAIEAFHAAADPKRFPAQLATYPAWQTKRIFWNSFNFQGIAQAKPGQYTLDVGGFNPLTGKSYGETAAESRSMHKSQGFGSIKQRGSALEFFNRLEGDSAGADIFSGIDLTLAKHKEFSHVSQLISKSVKEFDPIDPSRSLKRLSEIYKALLEIKTDNPQIRDIKEKKLRECTDLITSCAGLWVEALSAKPYATPGSMVTVQLMLVNRGPANVRVTGTNGTKGKDGEIDLTRNQNFTVNISNQVSVDAPLSKPFWLDGQNVSQINRFNASPYSGSAAFVPPMEINCDLLIEGTTVQIKRQVMFKKGDPVKGEIYEPLYIVAPVNISLDEKIYMFASGERKKITVKVTALADSVSGRVEFEVPQGWKVEAGQEPRFSLTTPGAEYTTDIYLQSTNETGGEINAIARVGERKYRDHIRWINYDHIPKQLLPENASSHLMQLNLGRGVTRVGYIEGAGDEVADCLKAAGYEVTLINEDMITPLELKKYEAVVTGIRAFNVNEKLYNKMKHLLTYVEGGGNLIVQYNTNSRVGPLNFVPGPYPFTISRQRTTDENAPVQWTDKKHPAMLHPNLITEKDLQGWVQERGIYYAEKADSRYEDLLRMKDPGEDYVGGSLITTRYGKGNYVYTGICFFRQLPAAVPGAYRIFANLLALPGEK